jgi:DNA invertase Pin-like site-specific DNA recombinase
VSQPARPELSQEAARDVSRGTPAKRPKAKRKDREPPTSGTGGARGLGAVLGPLREGEVVELSQRKLARALGVGKSSVNRTLAELRAAGELIVETTSAGTRLALA